MTTDFWCVTHHVHASKKEGKAVACWYHRPMFYCAFDFIYLQFKLFQGPTPDNVELQAMIPKVSWPSLANKT